jgi:hypothetical protein
MNLSRTTGFRIDGISPYSKSTFALQKFEKGSYKVWSHPSSIAISSTFL